MEPRPNPAARPVTSQRSRSPFLRFVAAAGAYEVVADVVNEVLGADLLPSFRHAVERFTWSSALRRLRPPSWATPVTLVAAGFTYELLRRRRPGRRPGPTARSGSPSPAR